MIPRSGSLAVWFLLAALPAAAQEPTPTPVPTPSPEPGPLHSLAKKTVLSGEVRVRFEWRDPLGYGNGVQLNNDQDFLHIRARINLETQVTEHLKAFVQIQDQRFAGDEPAGPPGSGNPWLPFSTTFGDGENTDVHQAFLEIQDLGGEDLDVRLGRFTMCYGSRRFL